MTNNEIVGKTLVELIPHLCYRTQGVAVYLLEQDEPDDANGKMVAEEFSLISVLDKHPELKYAVCVRHNFFFGEDILRVKIKNNKEEN